VEKIRSRRTDAAQGRERENQITFGGVQFSGDACVPMAGGARFFPSSTTDEDGELQGSSNGRSHTKRTRKRWSCRDGGGGRVVVVFIWSGSDAPPAASRQSVSLAGFVTALVFLFSFEEMKEYCWVD
jgi:hypothetical protein